MGKFNDLTGQKFERLLVDHIVSPTESRRPPKYFCICDCGNTTIATTFELLNRKKVSCGCRKAELIKKKHGMSESRLFSVWWDMVSRCKYESGKQYKNYGGRGIGICKEWSGEDGFSKFAEWAYEHGYDENAPFGECTIDRIDVDGDYCPENCRWVGRIDQMNNTTQNRVVTVNGESKTTMQWSRETGVMPNTFAARIKMGWSEEDAIMTPPKYSPLKGTGRKIYYNGEFRTIREWADFLGVCRSTIERRIKQGKNIDGTHPVKGRRIYSEGN